MSNYLNQPDQFRATSVQQPPKTNHGRTVAIVLSIMGILGLLGCGCCGGLFYWGMQIDQQDMANAVRDDPNVQQELGGIDQISMNWIKTNAENGNTYVYDVQGPTGKGMLYIEDDWGEINSARLVTENGEWDLEVQQPDLAW